MDFSAILLLLAIFIPTILFVARPFFENHHMFVVSVEEQQLSALMAERDRLLTTLQELDFDQALGKIPSEDYPVTRAELMQRAADVLRKLDAFGASRSPMGAEDRIEAAIAARRADAAAKSNLSQPESDDTIEALIASRKAARKEKSGGFCANCGKPILRSDRFCPHCGKPVRQE